jgi:hypothetical protein
MSRDYINEHDNFQKAADYDIQADEDHPIKGHFLFCRFLTSGDKSGSSGGCVLLHPLVDRTHSRVFSNRVQGFQDSRDVLLALGC